MTYINPKAVSARLAECKRELDGIAGRMRRKTYVPATSIEPPPEWANAPRPSGKPALPDDVPGIGVQESRIGRAAGHPVLLVICQCGRRWFAVWPFPQFDVCPRCMTYVAIDLRVPE